MFRELGIEPSALAVANHYCDLATGFVLDKIDEQLEGEIRSLNMQYNCNQYIDEGCHDDRSRLAQDVLNFIGGDL